MFELIEKKFGKYHSAKLLNLETSEYITLITDYGLCLNELVLNSNGKLVNVLLNSSNPADFEKTGIAMYSGVKLFPFPNRVKDAAYSFEGKNYSLPKNDSPRNHSLHGLVFDKVFTFKSFDKEQGIVEFQYNCDGESEYFPFSYLLTVAIRLIKQGVEIKTTVLNTGNADMPMGDGWHPYVSTGTKIDNLCIKIPANQYFKTDNTLIPTLEKMTEKSFSSLSLLGDCEMDSCFLISTTEGRVSTIIFDSEKNITIDLWQEVGSDKYNYVQYYTPKNRLSIAVEPMSCAPDAINNKIGLIRLAPQKQKEFVFGINIPKKQ